MFNFLNKSWTFTSVFVVALIVQNCSSVPSRQILKSNRKPTQAPAKTELKEDPTELAKIANIDSLITPLINWAIAIPTAIVQTITNVTSTGGSLISAGFNKTTSNCSPIDPLLVANIPGIFIGVPLVLIGIAILIAAIAAIVIAIGGAGGVITKDAYDNKYNSNKHEGGYAPSISPVYGAPVTSYGTPSSSYSDNGSSATQDFYQAYDKYNNLAAQPQPSSSYSEPYEGWNNNVVMKRMKQM